MRKYVSDPVIPGFQLKKAVHKQHECKPPNPREFINEYKLTVGTILECEVCEVVFTLRDSQTDGIYWSRGIGASNG